MKISQSCFKVIQYECFPVFHHLQKDKQRKQRHVLKLGMKRRNSFKLNYYIISPRVIIQAIISKNFAILEKLDEIFIVQCDFTGKMAA